VVTKRLWLSSDDAEKRAKHCLICLAERGINVFVEDNYKNVVMHISVINTLVITLVSAEQ